MKFLVIIALSALIACNTSAESDNEKELNEQKRFEMFHKMEQDSMAQTVENIRTVGRISEEKIKQGWKGEKLKIWQDKYLDSLNTEYNKIWIESRKNREAILRMEENK